MASIKDVAQKAGVGVGTVSRVLNNSGYVSDETREKIEEAMKNLQYTPNELARNLYHKKSGIICRSGANSRNSFFLQNLYIILRQNSIMKDSRSCYVIQIRHIMQNSNIWIC